VRRAFTVFGLVVIGLGAWVGARLPETSGGGQFHFNARSGPGGENPRGMYYAKEGIFGTFTFTAEVRCLRVMGNVAYIGTEVTRAQEGVQEGDPVVFRVEDNGDPGADKDRFVGAPGIDPETDCENVALQAVLTATSQTISQGNFTVHDG
jgi:hypothetical protein